MGNYFRRVKSLFVDKLRTEVYVYANDKTQNAQFGYPSNHYKTTKYTPWTFLIQNMFEQFRKYTNIYFVVVCDYYDREDFLFFLFFLFLIGCYCIFYSYIIHT